MLILEYEHLFPDIPTRTDGIAHDVDVEDSKPVKQHPPAILLLAVPRRLFCFGSLVILEVVCRYLSLFVLYINIKIGKNRC